MYNYFCPNDGTVSLKNVQGFGWRGIPGELASAIPNLRQRVFCQHVWVGKAPDEKPFEMPPSYKGDFKYSVATNASYTASDVIINGEELPETFMFRLQGQDNHPDNDEKTCDAPYKANIDPDSPDAYISYSAKAYAISRTASATYPLDDYQRRSWFPGHVLTESELQTESNKRNVTVIHGMVSGSKDFPALTLTWLKSRDELEKEWQKSDPVSYSQHSSVVMSEFAPSHAMAFDLAIGQCKAFNYKAGEFWEALLHRADWRDVHNGNVDAKEYYRTGRLPLEGTKNYMNKPDEVIPSLKECGVVNQFMNATKVIPSRDLATGNKEVPNTQWDRPDTLTDRQMKG